MKRNIKIAQNLCLIPGTFLMVSGLMLLFLPVAAKELFDLSNVAILKEPLALALGIRQFSMGLMIIALTISNQTKALSYIMLIGAMVPLVDFIVFNPSTGVISAFRHLAAVPFILGLGLYLLFQMRCN